MTPGWLTDLVWILSGGRITAESERYILHELPFARAIGYWHSYMFRKEGVWTIDLETRVSGKVAEKVDRLLAKVLAGEA